MTTVTDKTFVVTSLDDSQSLDSFVSYTGPTGGPFTPDEIADRDTADGGGLTLREAVHLANLFETLDGSTSTITFDPSLSGAVYRLTQGEIAIAANVTIDGDISNDSVAEIILSGDANADDSDADGKTVAQGGTGITDLSNTATSELDDNTRILNVSDAAFAVTLDGLTLTGGRTTSGGTSDGGAVRTEGTLDILNSVISGNNTTNTSAEGGAIFSRGNLTITGTTVTDNFTSGTGADGGAIFGDGTVTINDSTFSGNATRSSSAPGGAVAADDALIVNNSTFSDNQTSGNSVSRGGALYSAGTATLTNTTIADNATSGILSGGGGVAAFDTLSLINSTVTGNATSGNGATGGGIFSGTGIELTNSLVLGNATTRAGVGGDETYAPGAITFTGGNIVGTSFTVDGVATDTITDASEVFAATQTVGGVVSGVVGSNGTVALLRDSSNLAIDAGADSSAPAQDVLGQGRLDVPSVANNGGNISDLGAVEAVPEDPSLIVTTVDDIVDSFDGLTSLREAIGFALDGTAGNNGDGDADNEGDPNDTITFDSSVGAAFENAATITLTEGDFTTLGEITIDATGLDITIDADDASRHFSAFGGVLTLKNLTLINGNAGTGSGGSISANFSSTVALYDTTIQSSTAVSGGAVFINPNATVTVDTVTLAANTAGSGGAVATLGEFTAINATIHGNQATSG
ncbi:MAG: right-handed parallel beta-helix repeat-containing protein [Pseudomonadota bacterium]